MSVALYMDVHVHAKQFFSRFDPTTRDKPVAVPPAFEKPTGIGKSSGSKWH
jgi:hypothetical protein